MISTDVLVAIKNSTTIGELIGKLTESGSITCEERPDISLDRNNLLENLVKLDYLIVGPVECMDYVSRELGISYTLPYEYSKHTTNKLDSICSNLTELARVGKLDPVIGRESEISMAIHTLMRRTKSNPVLVGYAGCGKSSIVNGIAQRIVDGEVPASLIGKSIYSLDLGSILDDPQRAEGKVSEIIELARITGSILFIDEIHSIVPLANRGLGIISMLKPSLADGSLSLVGATTFEEYRKYIESDSALERRFNKIVVDEPSIDEAKNMLLGIKSRYEEYHGVEVPHDVISACVNLGKEYLSDRHLPDSAIDLLDASCVRVRKKDTVLTTPVNEWKRTISECNFMDAVVSKPRYIVSHDRDVVSVNDVVASASGLTGRMVYESIDKLLETLENKLLKYIVGQNEVIGDVCSSIKARHLYRVNPTMGCLYFVGCRGVGKSLLGDLLGDIVFNGKVLTLDMGEYTERHTVSNLIGSPPGYVGYSEGGILTNFVRDNRSSLVILDDIDLAHSSVQDLLVGALSSGKIRDMEDREVDFGGVLFLLTTNTGSDTLVKGSSTIGFGGGSTANNKDKVVKDSLSIFSDKLRDRVDRVLVFNPLTIDDMRKIVKLEVEKLNIGSSGPSITLTDGAIEVLLEGWSMGDGARYVKRELESKIVLPITREIDSSTRSITCSSRDGKIVFRKRR